MTWPAKLTLAAAPDSVSAVELATVKTELDITGSSEDAKLSRLIAAASVAMAGPEGTDRDYWRQSLTEDHAGRGGILLPLSIWPVETVTSVSWDGSAVTASEYSVVPDKRRELYREDGWNLSEIADERRNHRKILYSSVYIGGYWMPDQEPDVWVTATAYAAGEFVRKTSGVDQFYFEATTGGTSDANEPTWTTTEDDTVADNDITWTARGATLMPEDLQEAALIQTIDFYQGGLSVPGNISEHSHDGSRIKYRDIPATLSRAVQTICARYR